MFSFGFSDENGSKQDVIETIETSCKISDLQWKAANELKFDCDPLLPPSYLYTQGDVSLELASPEEVLKILSENEESCATAADSQHSDLLPAVYEGGLKVWECTDDLLKFASQSEFKSQLKGAKVLELGCGAGILGIFSLMQGADLVHFQDYNEEVLKYFTRPNLSLNLIGENLEGRVKYFSGDWESFIDLLPDTKYDFIFTSETIYNTDCYPKLLKIFGRMLSETGKVLLAAKSYYFGVGGGTRQFEMSLESTNELSHKVVWKSENGLHREIIQIEMKIN